MNQDDLRINSNDEHEQLFQERGCIGLFFLFIKHFIVGWIALFIVVGIIISLQLQSLMKFAISCSHSTKKEFLSSFFILADTQLPTHQLRTN